MKLKAPKHKVLILAVLVGGTGGYILYRREQAAKDAASSDYPLAADTKPIGQVDPSLSYPDGMSNAFIALSPRPLPYNLYPDYAPYPLYPAPTPAPKNTDKPGDDKDKKKKHPKPKPKPKPQESVPGVSGSVPQEKTHGPPFHTKHHGHASGPGSSGSTSQSSGFGPGQHLMYGLNVPNPTIAHGGDTTVAHAPGARTMVGPTIDPPRPHGPPPDLPDGSGKKSKRTIEEMLSLFGGQDPRTGGAVAPSGKKLRPGPIGPPLRHPPKTSPHELHPKQPKIASGGY